MNINWILQTFYQSTLIPLCLFINEKPERSFSNLTVELDFGKAYLQSTEVQRPALAFTMVEEHLFTGFISIDGTGDFVQVGPTTSFIPTNSLAQSLAKRMGKRPALAEKLSGELRKLPLYTVERSKAFLNMLDFMLNGKKDRTIAYLTADAKSISLKAEPMPLRFMLTADSTQERELISFVEYGRPDLMQEALTGLFNSGINVPDVTYDADRAFKNIFIFALGIVSRAALRGGADFNTMNEAVDSYIRLIEEQTGREQISRLLYRAFMHFSNMAALTKHSPGESNVTHIIKQTVLSRLNEKITPTLIAGLIKMDVSYLCKSFKKDTGLTISEYVNRVKIDECKRLLTATDLSIMEISVRLGYTTHNYMTSVFKKITGTTPDAFRYSVR